MSEHREHTRGEGCVVGLFIAGRAGEPTMSVEEVSTVAGCGIEGDRHFRPGGWTDAGRELTLIETEALEALAHEYDVRLAPSESRRNIATAGIALNHLVGRSFRIGDQVVCLGIQLCEPCGHLEKLTRPGVRKGLIHRGGLRAQIITGGMIRKGDPLYEP